MDNFYAGKNVLVTGGAGFIGSNLVKALCKQKANVYIIDDLSTGSLDNLKFSGEYEFFNVPVQNINIIKNDNGKNFIETYGIKYIFHLAARNIIVSNKNPLEDMETNIGGTLRLLLEAKHQDIAHFIYTSTASVYGNPRYLPINENDTVNLLTPYSVSKYAGEGYCMSFYESFGFPVTILRLSNVYGPGQSTSNPYCGVIAKFMDNASRGEDIKIHGNGLQTRDFTFVEDVINAILLAGQSERAIGEVFNVATGIETTVKGLAESIVTIHDWQKINTSNHDFKTSHITYIERRDIDNISRRVLNIEKIRMKLKWSPKYMLNEGLLITLKR